MIVTVYTPKGSCVFVGDDLGFNVDGQGLLRVFDRGPTASVSPRGLFASGAWDHVTREIAGDVPRADPDDGTRADPDDGTRADPGDTEVSVLKILDRADPGLAGAAQRETVLQSLRDADRAHREAIAEALSSRRLRHEDDGREIDVLLSDGSTMKARVRLARLDAGGSKPGLDPADAPRGFGPRVSGSAG